MRRARWLLLTLLLPTPALAGDEPVTVLLDGQPAPVLRQFVSDEEVRGPVRAGDMIALSFGFSGAFIVVQPGETRLELRRDGAQLVRLRRGDAWVPAVAGTAWGFDDAGERRLLDGLAELGDDELEQLRCIVLGAWSDDMASRLSRTDPARCVYVVEGDGVVLRDGRRVLPPIPRSARHLKLAVGPRRDAILDLRGLAGREALETLDLFSSKVDWGDPLLVEALASLTGLRALRLPPGTPTLEFLSGLGSLESLRAREVRARELPSLERASRLEAVDLREGELHDVTALAASPALRDLRLRGSAVKVLPADGFPALRRLDVLGTELSWAQVDAFRAAHPECAVVHGWTELLRAALQGATRLRVRTGSVCNGHQHSTERRTLLELEGDALLELGRRFGVEDERPAEDLERLVRARFDELDADADGRLAIAELRRLPRHLQELVQVEPGGALDVAAVRALHLRAYRHGTRSSWCGKLTLEVLQGDRLLAAVEIIERERARWAEWPGDGALTLEAKAYLEELEAQSPEPWPVE